MLNKENPNVILLHTYESMKHMFKAVYECYFQIKI